MLQTSGSLSLCLSLPLSGVEKVKVLLIKSKGFFSLKSTGLMTGCFLTKIYLENDGSLTFITQTNDDSEETVESSALT